VNDSLHAGEAVSNGRYITYVTETELEVRVRPNAEHRGAAMGEAIDDTHEMSSTQQQRDECRTDITGTACYEDPH
jgi:hypothetical protein